MVTVTPTAFDAFAADYDDTFTNSHLGRLLRQRVWDVYGRYFHPNQHLLELSCGTGADALWLAQQGCHITATDASPHMLAVTQQKAAQANLTHRITTTQLSLQDLIKECHSEQSEESLKPCSISTTLSEERSEESLLVKRPLHPTSTKPPNPISSNCHSERSEESLAHSTLTQQSKTNLHHNNSQFNNHHHQSDGRRYDGLYTNFGGLNTINQWSALAPALAPLLRPQATLILVPMGPLCPWEVAWYATHGRFQTALRRFRDHATATVGQHTIPIWYPSARQLRRAFAPHFTHLHTESLGTLLPPSYLAHLVEKRPSLFDRLNQWEKRLAPLTRGWGDHYILILQKNG